MLDAHPIDPGDPMPVTIEGSQNKHEIRGENNSWELHSTVFFHGGVWKRESGVLQNSMCINGKKRMCATFWEGRRC